MRCNRKHGPAPETGKSKQRSQNELGNGEQRMINAADATGSKRRTSSSFFLLLKQKSQQTCFGRPSGVGRAHPSQGAIARSQYCTVRTAKVNFFAALLVVCVPYLVPVFPEKPFDHPSCAMCHDPLVAALTGNRLVTSVLTS